MAGLRQATSYVFDDEPCLYLFETNRQVLNAQGQTEDRRFQHIGVLRSGKEAEYVEDLGPSVSFRAAPFMFPPVGKPVEKVGHLREWASRLREDRPFHVRQGLESPNLAELYVKQGEERWKRAMHRSVFGPALMKARN